jgi:thioredoxin 1
MTFSELINSDKPVLVDFFAEWCGPCKAMAPILEDVKRRVGDGGVIYKIDVDRNPMVASAFNVRSIPTLIVFQNGKPQWRKTGMASAIELQRVMEDLQKKEA